MAERVTAGSVPTITLSRNSPALALEPYRAGREVERSNILGCRPICLRHREVINTAVLPRTTHPEDIKSFLYIFTMADNIKISFQGIQWARTMQRGN